MAALTIGRTVKSIAGILSNFPVKADAVIHQGAIVVLDSTGYAKPAVTGLNLIPVGIARETVDATGLASGAVTIETELMIAGHKNSTAGDQIGITEIGKEVFLVDDQTVAKTSATNTRSVAGYARRIEGGLVFVELKNHA